MATKSASYINLIKIYKQSLLRKLVCPAVAFPSIIATESLLQHSLQ